MENGGSKLPFYLGGLSEVFWSRFQALSFRAIGRAKQTFNERLDPHTFLAREVHFEPQSMAIPSTTGY